MFLEPAGFAGEINRTPWRSKRQASHLLAPARPSPVQSGSPLFSSIAPSTTATQCTLDTALICSRDTNYRFIRSMKTTLQIIPRVYVTMFFQHRSNERTSRPVIYRPCITRFIRENRNLITRSIDFCRKFGQSYLETVTAESSVRAHLCLRDPCFNAESRNNALQ